ncbi:nucleoside triphosphate pyrophosphohydrolase family protein [Bacillus pumilus]|uniref:hypothetical protein n=1 Tax=Bacillus pumilus TaxID=1408 RepID=UPI0011A9EB2B|nr:hypothetical protein [Bacillus pumilus]
MNLEKMFEMQAELDNSILRKKAGRSDLLPNTYVGIGFNLDQIEAAYVNTNAVNHLWQQEGD